ncbi:MAG: amidohydrolase family protein [Acidimicrobiales bacterium]
MRTVIRNGVVLTMDPSLGLVDPGTVVIEDDIIVEITAGDGSIDGDVVIDATGHAVIPGLVNGHAHARPARALGDGLTLREWHDRYPDNVVRRMQDEDAWLGAVAGCGELLLGGCTTVLAMPNFPTPFGAGCDDVGIRACVAAHATDIEAMADSCDSLESNLAAVEANAPFADARIQYWFGFEHQNAATDDLVVEMTRLAQKYETGLTSHLCESAGDIERHVERHGARPVPRYDELGAIGPHAVYAHGNWLDADEIALFAERDAALVHNPVSNMRMGTGIADVPAWLEAGIRFALGTDGMLSSYRLDMWEVIRATAMLARVTAKNPELLPSKQLLYLATQGGADALGLGDRIGSLTPGKQADVAVIDLQRLHLAPRSHAPHDNLESLLAFCVGPEDVRHVLVAGNHVVADAELTTVDERSIVDRLAGRIGPLSELFGAGVS